MAPAIVDPDAPGEQSAAGAICKVRRRAPRELRREQLIHATIDAIAAHGYASTTMAHITDNAGLSRGIVNFHFSSKEILFVETLRYMAEEYIHHWQAAVAAAGPGPAARLQALLIADFDPSICNRRKISTWTAFRAEAMNKPAYRALCWSLDEDLLGTIRATCAAMQQEAGYAYSPGAIASGIYAMQEGLWLRLLLEPDDIDLESARRAALGIVGSLFPVHFMPDGRLRDNKETPV